MKEQHAHARALKPYNQPKTKVRLSQSDIDLIGQMMKEKGISQAEIARRLNRDRLTVRAIMKKLEQGIEVLAPYGKRLYIK